jgi:hypothetical protein
VTRRAVLVVLGLLAGALALTAGAAPAAAASPVCQSGTVQYPASLPSQTTSAELDAAFRAICAAPNSNLVGLIKNAGTAEQALVRSTTTAAADATGELMAVRTAAGVLPSLSTIGTIGAGIAAFDVGWKIGRGIDTKWLHLTRNEPTVATSTYLDGAWFQASRAEVLDRTVTQYFCTAYFPDATGCDYTTAWTEGRAISRPVWDQWAGTSDDGTTEAPDIVWVFGRRNASSYQADQWVAFNGLRECAIYINFGCSQPVLDYRSTVASAIPRVDVHVLPGDTLQNDGWFMPNTDPPSYGTFVVRTQQQMQRHVKADLQTYRSQRADYTSTLTMPSDTTIGASVRTELLKPENKDAAQFIGNTLDPTTVPPAGTLYMPSCDGLDYFGCLTVLRNAGLLGNVLKLTLAFDTAVIGAGPNGVVKTSPRVGTTLNVDDAVTLTVNPGLAAMPVLVPSIDAGTAVEDAKQAITAAGLEPVLDVNATPDPAYGPDVVTSPETVPRARTRAHRGDDVTVRVNGPAAPPVGAGSCEAWVRPRIDLSPLNAVPLLNKFPFAAPMWVHDLLALWVVGATAPQFHVPFPFAPDGIDIDMSIWDAAMPIWRGTVLAVSFVLLAWSFMGMAFGFGRGGDD